MKGRKLVNKNLVVPSACFDTFGRHHFTNIYMFKNMEFLGKYIVSIFQSSQLLWTALSKAYPPFCCETPTRNSASYQALGSLVPPMSAGLLGAEKYDAFALGLGHQGSRL